MESMGFAPWLTPSMPGGVTYAVVIAERRR